MSYLPNLINMPGRPVSNLEFQLIRVLGHQILSNTFGTSSLHVQLLFMPLRMVGYSKGGQTQGRGSCRPHQVQEVKLGSFGQGLPDPQAPGIWSRTGRDGEGVSLSLSPQSVCPVGKRAASP